MSTCRACPAVLRFAKTATGSGSIPLEEWVRVPAEARERATMYYVIRDELAVKIDLAKEGGLDERIYVSHFQTCPDAQRFTRRKR